MLEPQDTYSYVHRVKADAHGCGYCSLLCSQRDTNVSPCWHHVYHWTETAERRKRFWYSRGRSGGTRQTVQRFPWSVHAATLEVIRMLVA